MKIFDVLITVNWWYGDDVYNTVEENSSVISLIECECKGVRAVKLCTNKILQFVTGGAGY